MPKSALIAVGGNSLIRAGESGTVADQLRNTRLTAAAIVRLLQQGFKIALTHGNGPQVGAALLRSERSADQVYSQPLDICDAATQGEIGYELQQALDNEIARTGLKIPVVTLITQCVVSDADPAMQHPTKPVGPFYSRSEAELRKRLYDWTIAEDASRGYRRTVPSPEPIDIVEIDTIRSLINTGTLVIAAGGGGIPVVRTRNGLIGVEAVIDKDRASALLATKLGVELFIISTDANYVYLNYKTSSQRELHDITATELEEYFREGQFPPGNMGPKVDSALRFLRAGGRHVIITSYEHLAEAVEGHAGTHIFCSEKFRPYGEQVRSSVRGVS